MPAMPDRTRVAVYNGRLLPESLDVDFVLWAQGRDFELLDDLDAIVLASMASDSSGERAGGNDEDEADPPGGVVPRPG
jgi:hypothetical protein